MFESGSSPDELLSAEFINGITWVFPDLPEDGSCGYIGEFRVEMLDLLMTAKKFMEGIVAPIMQLEGLTVLQTFILSAVRSGKIDTVGGLCRDMKLSQPNASTICKKLERDGFLARIRSNEDERVVTLSLTEKGVNALCGIERLFKKFDPLLGRIPRGEIDKIIDGFRASLNIFNSLQPQFEEILAAERGVKTNN